MKLKLLKDKLITRDCFLKAGSVFEVEDIVIDEYKIKIPMKQKNRFRYVLVKDDEGVLVE